MEIKFDLVESVALAVAIRAGRRFIVDREPLVQGFTLFKREANYLAADVVLGFAGTDPFTVRVEFSSLVHDFPYGGFVEIFASDWEKTETLLTAWFDLVWALRSPEPSFKDICQRGADTLRFSYLPGNLRSPKAAAITLP